MTSLIHPGSARAATAPGGLGLVSVLLAAILLVVLVGAVGLAPDMRAPVVFARLPVLALYIVALLTVFMALGAIFRTGTYVYATTGKAPSSMDPALLQGAFRKKD